MPPFKLKLKHTRLVNGQPHYDVAMLAQRGDHLEVCGLLMLHANEWDALRLICEVVGIGIEVRDEAIPAAVPQNPAI